MVSLEIRPKSGPFGRWWHRPVVWLQRLLAPPNFAMVLADGNTGHVYSDVPLDITTIMHEAQHVWQSICDGEWLFRFKWCTMRGRLIYESEGYARGWLSEYGTDRAACADYVVAKIKEVASVYWLGEITSDDEVLIRKTVRTFRAVPTEGVTWTQIKN